jgi:acetyl-CoA C-acetyltransferase
VGSVPPCDNRFWVFCRNLAQISRRDEEKYFEGKFVKSIGIIGIGQIPVGEHWGLSLRDMAVEAAARAISDAALDPKGIDMIVAGTMLADTLSSQSNVGPLIADALGCRGIEALRVEASCASGAAALRTGIMAVASGMRRAVLVVGVEKMTDFRPDLVSAALSRTLDADAEGIQGITLPAVSALATRMYLEQYGYEKSAFAPFVINAHANGRGNPNAMYRKNVGPADYAGSEYVSSPLQTLDCAPVCDGAAAVVIASSPEFAKGRKQVNILGSGVATDGFGLCGRKNPLWLGAVHASTRLACHEAGVDVRDIDFFELHDAFSIMTALSLEACGCAEPGKGVLLAEDIRLKGTFPLSTMGGLKARGHPVGATGVYQAVEACLQLRHEAGANQVRDARYGLIQNIGGFGSIAFTHILGRS